MEIEYIINKFINFRNIITKKIKNKFEWKIYNCIDNEISLFTLTSSVQFNIKDVKELNIIKDFEINTAPYYEVQKINDTENDISIYIGYNSMNKIFADVNFINKLSELL